MTIAQDLRQLVKPYYILNILLSFSYVGLKRIPGVCNYLFNVDECELDGRETEILFFLLIVVMIRTRKAGSVSMINYLTASFIYTKVANLILWFYADLAMGLVFGVVFVLVALLVPEPTRDTAAGEKLVYFGGVGPLDEEIKRNHGHLLVCFYAAWSPACATFAPVYSRLSSDLALANLRFGKVDVGRWPEAGRQYRVSDASASKQLPTLVMFVGGKEVGRRPVVEAGAAKPFVFTRENVVAAFDLVNVHTKCKEEAKEAARRSQGRIKAE